MKQNTDHTQDTIFGVISRAHFLGIAVGYAAGLAAEGLLHMDGMLLEIIGVVIGFGIGWWVNCKYAQSDTKPVDSSDKHMQSE